MQSLIHCEKWSISTFRRQNNPYTINSKHGWIFISSTTKQRRNELQASTFAVLSTCIINIIEQSAYFEASFFPYFALLIHLAAKRLAPTNISIPFAYATRWGVQLNNKGHHNFKIVQQIPSSNLLLTISYTYFQNLPNVIYRVAAEWVKPWSMAVGEVQSPLTLKYIVGEVQCLFCFGTLYIKR